MDEPFYRYIPRYAPEQTIKEKLGLIKNYNLGSNFDAELSHQAVVRARKRLRVQCRMALVSQKALKRLKARLKTRYGRKEMLRLMRTKYKPEPS